MTLGEIFRFEVEYRLVSAPGEERWVWEQGIPVFGPDGAAFSPTHTRKGDRLYRYYVSQTVLKHGAGSCPVGRVPAGEIEGAVIDQLRAVFRQPEMESALATNWSADAVASIRQAADGLNGDIHGSAEYRAHLVTVMGASRVVLGTDYPFDMGEDDPVGLIERTPGLSAEEREMLVGGNAARLRGIGGE